MFVPPFFTEETLKYIKTFKVGGTQNLFKISDISAVREIKDTLDNFNKGYWQVHEWHDTKIYRIESFNVAFQTVNDPIILEDWFESIIDLIPENRKVIVETPETWNSISMKQFKLLL